MAYPTRNPYHRGPQQMQLQQAQQMMGTPQQQMPPQQPMPPQQQQMPPNPWQPQPWDTGQMLSQGNELFSMTNMPMMGGMTPMGAAFKSGGGGDINNDFLWKPTSESDGNLVVLTPNKYNNTISGAYVVTPDGQRIEGRFTTNSHNGNRGHFRFPFRGDSLPDGSYFVMEQDDGTQVIWNPDSPGSRFTSGEPTKVIPGSGQGQEGVPPGQQQIPGTPRPQNPSSGGGLGSAVSTGMMGYMVGDKLLGNKPKPTDGWSGPASISEPVFNGGFGGPSSVSGPTFGGGGAAGGVGAGAVSPQVMGATTPGMGGPVASATAGAMNSMASGAPMAPELISATAYETASPSIASSMISPQTGAMINTAAPFVGGAAALHGGYNLIDRFGDMSAGTGAMYGAETGAGIGTMILPGVGTAIGAVVGTLGGLAASAFNSGKHSEQKDRDSIRDVLMNEYNESGFIDDNWNMTVGDVTFDIGKDGRAELQGPSGGRAYYQIDPGVEKVGSMIGMVAPLSAIISDGHQKQTADFSGYFVNAMLESQMDKEAWVRDLYTQMGIERGDAADAVVQMWEEEKITEQERDAYLASIDTTWRDDIHSMDVDPGVDFEPEDSIMNPNPNMGQPPTQDEQVADAIMQEPQPEQQAAPQPQQVYGGQTYDDATGMAIQQDPKLKKYKKFA